MGRHRKKNKSVNLNLNNDFLVFLGYKIPYFCEWWIGSLSWRPMSYQELSGEGQWKQISKVNKPPVFIQRQDEMCILRRSSGHACQQGRTKELSWIQGQRYLNFVSLWKTKMKTPCVFTGWKTRVQITTFLSSYRQNQESLLPYIHLIRIKQAKTKWKVPQETCLLARKKRGF